MIRYLAALAAPSLLPGIATAAEKAAEKTGGMPQLNVPDFAPQLFWLGIWFIVLYVLMAKVGLPRIGAVLDRRRQHREEDLARAARLKPEAEEASAGSSNNLRHRSVS